MSRTVALALALALLTGCATCRRHPVACTAVATVVIGGAVAAYETQHGTTTPARTIRPVMHLEGP